MEFFKLPGPHTYDLMACTALSAVLKVSKSKHDIETWKVFKGQVTRNCHQVLPNEIVLSRSSWRGASGALGADQVGIPCAVNFCPLCCQFSQKTFK